MSQREILTNGNAFKRTDGRWGGTVWYLDEKGERKRKSFSGTTKSEVNQKMKKYILEFNQQKNDSVESLKTLEESLQNWLQVFKFPAVERTTYDRAESVAKNQIYPRLGKKVVGDITASDIKKLLNYWMTEGYAYTTVKKVYVLLNEYFRYLYQQEIITKNPMANVEMIKKANFMSAQGKENLPPTDTITVFSEEEIEKFKSEAFSVFGNGKQKYQQAAAYILMLNTGMRTEEALGLLNSDVDLENGRSPRLTQLGRRLGEPRHAHSARRKRGQQARRRHCGEWERGNRRQTKKRYQQARRPTERHSYRNDQRPPQRILLRRRQSTHPGRARRSHSTRQLPQKILQNSQGGRHRNERPPQPPSHLRHQIDQRHER